jgi:hypothetical protein
MKNDYINNIFKEMCLHIDVDYNSIDFSKDNWYRTKSWDNNQRTKFKLWLADHLKSNEVSILLCDASNMSKDKRESASEWFLFNYGWTLNGVSNTLSSYQKKAWLYEFYEASKNANKAKDIYPVVKNIKKLFADKEYLIVDEILKEVQLDQLSYTAMVAFVSASFPARRSLINWNALCDRVKEKLDDMGLDSSSILIGFID